MRLLSLILFAALGSGPAFAQASGEYREKVQT